MNPRPGEFVGRDRLPTHQGDSHHRVVVQVQAGMHRDDVFNRPFERSHSLSNVIIPGSPPAISLPDSGPRTSRLLYIRPGTHPEPSASPQFGSPLQEVESDCDRR